MRLLTRLYGIRTKCPDIFEMVRHNIIQNLIRHPAAHSSEPSCVEIGAMDTEYGTKASMGWG